MNQKGFNHNLLEAKGLIEKAVVENPRKITYRLSDSGKKISEKLYARKAGFLARPKSDYFLN